MEVEIVWISTLGFLHHVTRKIRLRYMNFSVQNLDKMIFFFVHVIFHFFDKLNTKITQGSPILLI